MHLFHFKTKPGNSWPKKEVITSLGKNLRVVKRKKDSKQRTYIFEDIIWGIDIQKGHKYVCGKENQGEVRFNIP